MNFDMIIKSFGKLLLQTEALRVLASGNTEAYPLILLSLMAMIAEDMGKTIPEVCTMLVDFAASWEEVSAKFTNIAMSGKMMEAMIKMITATLK